MTTTITSTTTTTTDLATIDNNNSAITPSTLDDVSSSSEPKFSTTEQQLSFDLGNLCAFYYHPLDTKAFNRNPGQYLAESSRDKTQLLINRIFTQPTKRVEIGIVIAQLPPPTTAIPREKPLPQAKPKTRWEVFRDAKGIQKRKKDRMIWDENYGEWRPRWGFKRAHNDNDEWILDAKPGDAAGSDPFSERATKKKETIAKQHSRERRNRDERSRNPNLPGVIAINNPEKRNDGRMSVDKSQLKNAFTIASSSTASMGKFDNKIPGQPKLKRGRQQFESNIQDLGQEKKKSLGVLDRILSKEDKVDMNKAVNLYNTEQQSKGSNSNKRKRTKK